MFAPPYPFFAPPARPTVAKRQKETRILPDAIPLDEIKPAQSGKSKNEQSAEPRKPGK